jgi:ubiquitin-protein ligase
MSEPKLNKRLYTDITRLKLLDKKDAKPRFKLTQSPFTGDDNEVDQVADQPREEYLIIGQIFPMSNIYCERSYSIEIKLTKTFPADPPEVQFLTPMYHPNVGIDGKSKSDNRLRYVNIFFREIL